MNMDGAAVSKGMIVVFQAMVYCSCMLPSGNYMYILCNFNAAQLNKEEPKKHSCYIAT